MRARTLLLGFGVVGAGLLVAASSAWACTNLATLNLSQPAATSGEQITVTGSSFKVATGDPIPVMVHWGSATGPVLASVAPDPTGNISATLTIPDAQPGYYTMFATQTVKGFDYYGTPALAAFQLLTPGQPANITPNAVQGGTGTAGPGTSSTGLIALTVTLGVLGLVLFCGGVGAFVRQAGRREVAAKETVKHQ